MNTLYFVRAHDLVKIGITDTLERRIAQLQTGNPIALEVMATIPTATYELEKLFHRTLKRWHVRGEWFTYKPLQELIKNIREGARPCDEESIVTLLELKFKGPKRKKTPPPEGFGPIIGEVRFAFRTSPIDWLRTREIYIAKGGLYAQAVDVVDKKFNGKYRADLRRSPNESGDST